MSRAAEIAFHRRLLEKLGRLGIRYVKPKVPSKTLRKSLNFFAARETKGYIQIPHYWALYVHDGRQPFSMPAGRYLVWFRDPADDPRLPNGVSPVRAKDLRHLSAEEYSFWLDQNRQAVKDGREPPMIVTRRIRKPTPPTHFFENNAGMKGFAEFAEKAVAEDVQEYLRTEIGKGGLLDIKDTASFHL
jgi:hypothetical protein